jgi:hypothetical protein
MRRRDRTRKAREAEAKLEPITGDGRKLNALTQLLVEYRKQGDHHTHRMTLAGLALTKRLGTQQQWVDALGLAWGDRADAEATWRSTEALVRAGIRPRGLYAVRKEFGACFMQKLSVALAADLGTRLASVLARIGFTRVKLDFDPVIAAIKEHGSRDLVKKRQKKVGVSGPRKVERRYVLAEGLGRVDECRRMRRDASCSVCGEVRCQTHLKCQDRLGCDPCSKRYVFQFFDMVSEKWKDEAKYQVAEAIFDSRAEALRAKKDLGDARSFLAPTLLDRKDAPVRWKLVAVTFGMREGSLVRGAMPNYKANLSKAQALDAVLATLCAPRCVFLDLVQAGRHVDAAKLYDELHNKPIASRKGSLYWPTSEDLGNKRKEFVQEQQGCGHDVDDLYDVWHEPSNTKVVDKAKFPPTFKEAVDSYRQGVLGGFYESPIAEPVGATSLRL